MNIFAGNFESAKKLLIFLLTVVAVLAFGASRAFAEETGVLQRGLRSLIWREIAG